VSETPIESPGPGNTAPTVHASAVRVGTEAVLIRGPSGSGKSRLAFDLILAGRSGILPSTVLIADDRVYLEGRKGRLIARAVPRLAGLIEIRGLGIRRCDFVSEAPVGLLIDLAAADAARLPGPERLTVSIYGIKIPRIPIQTGFSALPLVVASLTTSPGVAEPG